VTDSAVFERRVFRIGACFVAAGTLVTLVVFGPKYAVSFLIGGALSALNLRLLIRTINAALARASRVSPLGITAGTILRLLLIPLGLYGIMHFFFSGIIAATAGFAVFGGGILAEGIFEAVRRDAR